MRDASRPVTSVLHALAPLDDLVEPTGLQPPDDISMWLDTPSASSPSIAPDASLVAYVSDASGTPALWVAPLIDGGYRVGPARLVPTGPAQVTGVAFAPSGEWIAVATAPGGGENTEVLLVRPDGSGLCTIAGGPGLAATLGRWTADGTRLAVCVSDASGLTSGHLIDVHTGGWTFVTVGEALVVCDVSRDNSTVLVRTGPRGVRRFELVDVATGATRPLPAGERAVAGSVAQGRLSADGLTAYLLTDAGRDMAALVAVRFGPGGRRVAGVEVLAERDDAELERFALAPDGRRAVLVWNVDGRSALSLLDLASGRSVSLPPLPRDVATSVLFRPDGRALVLALDGPAVPSQLWTYEIASASAGYRCLVAPGPFESGPVASAVVRPAHMQAHMQRTLVAVPDGSLAGFSSPGVPSTAMHGRSAAEAVRPTLERFRSHDGLELTGWLYRPRGVQGPMPMMLHFHGGPEAQERPTFNPLFQALVASGIAVFAPNIRGSAGYGRAFVEADDLGRRFDAIADVPACVRHLVARGLAAPGRIGVMGRSYGGYLTLAALVSFPELFRVGVDVCGMADLETFYTHTEAWIASTAVTKYGHPDRDRDLLRSLSPLHEFDRLSAPLLVVHGANDTNVPLFEAEQTVAAARAVGVPTRFLLFPDEGHEAHGHANRTLFVRTTVDWISDVLFPQEVRAAV